MSIGINGVDILANDIEVTVSVASEVESRPIFLRNNILNSILSDGSRLSEIELLDGRRAVIKHSTLDPVIPVPMNNDNQLNKALIIWKLLTVSIRATAADADSLSGIQSGYKDSLDFYAKRRIYTAQLNDPDYTISKKQEVITALDNLMVTGFDISVPGIRGKFQFIESNGLNISYWTNGPYADLTATVVQRTKYTLTED